MRTGRAYKLLTKIPKKEFNTHAGFYCEPGVLINCIIVQPTYTSICIFIIMFFIYFSVFYIELRNIYSNCWIIEIDFVYGSLFCLAFLGVILAQGKAVVFQSDSSSSSIHRKLVCHNLERLKWCQDISLLHLLYLIRLYNKSILGAIYVNQFTSITSQQLLSKAIQLNLNFSQS